MGCAKGTSGVYEFVQQTFVHVQRTEAIFGIAEFALSKRYFIF